MTWIEWYDSLAKPSWTPAPATISLIRTILCPVIFAGFGFVLARAFRRRGPGGAAVRRQPRGEPAVHAVLRRAAERPLAAADIVIVRATLVWCVVGVWPHARRVAVARGPYLVWASVAPGLQLSITAMNR